MRPTQVTGREAGASVNRLRGGLLLCMSVAMLAGCMQLPGKPPVVVECSAPTSPDRPGPALVGQNYGMAMTPLPLNSVQFGSTALARSAAIQNLYAARTATNSVHLSARFVSCRDEPASMRVRTSFLRTDTSPAEAPTPWKLVFLPPRATAVYSELSTAMDVASYLVEVTE